LRGQISSISLSVTLESDLIREVTFDGSRLIRGGGGSIVTPNSQKEFEDTKGVTRICKLKKDRQHNGQKKKEKTTNNDLQNAT